MKPILEYDDYLQDLLQEIEKIKSRNGKGLFRVNDKMSDGTAQYVRNYFKGKLEYALDMRKCAQCLHSYDVIIVFREINNA
jgi:hypothetical protein